MQAQSDNCTSYDIVNCTPHDITLFDADGKTELVTFKAERGREARVSETDESFGTRHGVELKQRTYGAIIGLPAPVAGTYYIVSMIVLLVNETLSPALWREDLIAPDTGSGVVRNEKGVIIGTKNFVCL